MATFKPSRIDWIGWITLTALAVEIAPVLPQPLALAEQPGNPQIAFTQTNPADPNQLMQQGIAQNRAGHTEAAIKHWQQALELYQQAHNQSGEAAALTYLGSAYVSLERYRDAITTLETYRLIAQSLNDRRGEALALGNLGIAYEAVGHYGKAIEVHKQAGKLMLALGDRPGLGQVLLNLGNTFEAVGDYDNATAVYQQSLKIAQQTGDRAGEGIALGNLGAIYANLGNYDNAMAAHQKSLEIARAIPNYAAVASALINLGATYHSLGKRDNALNAYQQALTAAQTARDRRREGEALGSLGLVYEDLKNYPQAIEQFQKSLAIARATGRPEAEAIALNNLGHALFGAGKLAEAETQLQTAIQLLDSLGSGLSDTYQVSIFDTRIHIDNLLQQIQVAANQPDKALEAAERGRAWAFVRLLLKRLQGLDDQQRVKPFTITQIQQIARQHNATLVEYAIVPDDDFKFRGKQRGRESQLFIWVIQPSGKIDFRQVDLKPLWQKKATLTDVVQVARCLVPGDDCGAVARAIRDAPRQPPRTTTDAPEPIAVRKQPGLRKLYDLLIAPIADLLPQNPNHRIIFIPQETLFLVPFAALQAPDGNYLIERHTILTAPSIQVLALTQRQRVRSEGRGERSEGGGVRSGETRRRGDVESLELKVKSSELKVQSSEFGSSAQNSKLKTQNSPLPSLVIGNPTMPQVSLEPGQPSSRLAPLPESEQEALKIAEILKTKALIGDQATKAAVMRQLPGARIIHLATHGLLEYGSQGNYVSLQGLGVPGAIALAPSNQDDGLLTSDEILNLRLNADLVVLSACSTGQGRITGDGVIGLSRAFISAGVPSTVVSLWAVPDAPTARLMTLFYQNLQQRADKAIALRQAMLDTMQQYPEPLDWAAFTLIGEAD